MLCTASKSGPPSKMSATAEANVDVTVGAMIDAQTDWDVVRTAVPRDVEEIISRGFAVVPPIRFIWDYTQWRTTTDHGTQDSGGLKRPAGDSHYQIEQTILQ